MEKIQINIETVNSAFDEGNMNSEVARILRSMADRIEEGFEVGTLRDVNGNKTGTVEYFKGRNFFGLKS